MAGAELLELLNHVVFSIIGVGGNGIIVALFFLVIVVMGIIGVANILINTITPIIRAETIIVVIITIQLPSIGPSCIIGVGAPSLIQLLLHSFT